MFGFPWSVGLCYCECLFFVGRGYLRAVYDIFCDGGHHIDDDTFCVVNRKS